MELQGQAFLHLLWFFKGSTINDVTLFSNKAYVTKSLPTPLYGPCVTYRRPLSLYICSTVTVLTFDNVTFFSGMRIFSSFVILLQRRLLSRLQLRPRPGHQGRPKSSPLESFQSGTIHFSPCFVDVLNSIRAYILYIFHASILIFKFKILKPISC